MAAAPVSLVALAALFVHHLSGVASSVGSGSSTPQSHTTPSLIIERAQCTFAIDGRLNERCYSKASAMSQFGVAGEPATAASPTRAWLFWDDEGLIFAFDCDDRSLEAAAPTGEEPDVDRQDRVELFLWSGDPDDQYFCIEIGARGAVHDYAARFYRKFDSSWRLDGLRSAVSSTDRGYQVEARLPASTLGGLGFPLTPGSRWRLGLFRADFTAGHREPQWITWVDARTPSPDFHVAGAFGRAFIGQTSR